MLTEERFFIMSLQERDCWTLQTMLMYRVSTGSTHQAGIPCAGYTIRLHILPCLSSWGNTYSPEVHRQIFVRQDKSRISNLNCQISLSWLKDIINLCSSTYLANTHLRLQWLCQIHQSFIFLKPKLYPKWFYGVLGAQVLFSNIVVKLAQCVLKLPCSVGSITSQGAIAAFPAWWSFIAQPRGHSSLISMRSIHILELEAKALVSCPWVLLWFEHWTCSCAPVSVTSWL